MGVDAPWEFRMYRAANPINFNTIADVLITFEYTALESFDYEQQVLGAMDHALHGERAFSFRYLLPDQWYDLKNADLTATPGRVEFDLRKGDFPGLAALKIESVTLMMILKDGVSLTSPLFATLLLEPDNSLSGNANVPSGPIGGQGSSNASCVISTRTAGPSGSPFNNGQSQPGPIIGMLGKVPIGKWTFDVVGVPTLTMIKAGEIEDILLIIGYKGDSPGYL
jgi:hypothetical protein